MNGLLRRAARRLAVVWLPTGRARWGAPRAPAGGGCAPSWAPWRSAPGASAWRPWLPPLPPKLGSLRSFRQRLKLLRSLCMGLHHHVVRFRKFFFILSSGFGNVLCGFDFTSAICAHEVTDVPRDSAETRALAGPGSPALVDPGSGGIMRHSRTAPACSCRKRRLCAGQRRFLSCAPVSISHSCCSFN